MFVFETGAENRVKNNPKKVPIEKFELSYRNFTLGNT
jgi:hypothetical protein